MLLVFAICTLVLAISGTGVDDIFGGTSRATAAAAGITTVGPLAIRSPSDGPETTALRVDASGNGPGSAAPGLGAGETAQRVIDLTNTSPQRLRAITVGTVASPSSTLDTDRVNGLQLVVDRCSVPWTGVGGGSSGAPFAYACYGVTSTVLDSRPVVMSDTAVPGLALDPGAHNFLRASLRIAGSEPTLEGQFSTIHYTFRAVS